MKAIVTTTIFPPSEAVKRFASMNDWKLIVVGDKKTPHELYTSIPNIVYMTPEYQELTYPELSQLIGWNCIQFSGRSGPTKIYATPRGRIYCPQC